MRCAARRNDTPLARSLKNRLLNKAREQNRPFNDLLQQYFNERFLYRLSISQHRRRFVLKGALMLVTLDMPTVRPTRDIDLLGHLANQTDNIHRVFREICLGAEASDDGVWFDPDSIEIVDITKGAAYVGKRVKLTAYLGKACNVLQVDIGFGDVLVSEPQETIFPPLLPEIPAPRLLGYPVEAIVAEKVETMVRHGAANTRMKDFYDVWMLLKDAKDCTSELKQALQATFRRRGTRVPHDIPTAWTPTFAERQSPAWEAFLKRSRLRAPSLKEVVHHMRAFLWPCLQATGKLDAREAD